MSLSRDLIECVLALRFEDLTPEDVACVRMLLLDHTGVAAAGSRSEAAAAARALAADRAGLAPAQARERQRTRSGDAPAATLLPFVGTCERAPALEAALGNGVAAHALEVDDVHNGASSHPGAVIFPAVWAAAALAGAGARSFVLAAVRGYEVMCRVGRALNPPAHYARHFHPTATSGYLGAAAAAASLLELSAGAATSALGIAATMAAGSMEFLADGAWTKRLHPGLAARGGVEAALLARRGYRGPADAIGGARGLLAGYSDDPRPERLLAGLGADPLEVHRTSLKPHTCCRYEQGPIDCLLELRARHGVRPGDVARVTLGLLSAGMDIVAIPPEAKRRPRSVVDAQFSMPFGAAVALADGCAGLEQHQPARLADPELLALMDRVECVADPGLDRAYPARWPAWARIDLRDGRTLESRTDFPRGDPENPLPPEAVREKFDALTEPVYRAQRRDAIAAAVARVGEAGSSEVLRDLLPSDVL